MHAQAHFFPLFEDAKLVKISPEIARIIPKRRQLGSVTAYYLTLGLEFSKFVSMMKRARTKKSLKGKDCSTLESIFFSISGNGNLSKSVQRTETLLGEEHCHCLSFYLVTGRFQCPCSQ